MEGKYLSACAAAAQTADCRGGARNVLMPLGFLVRLAELLSYWDISSYDYVIQRDYDDAMDTIAKKLQAVELRKAYSKITCANDDESRFYARMEYLRLRGEARG